MSRRRLKPNPSKILSGSEAVSWTVTIKFTNSLILTPKMIESSISALDGTYRIIKSFNEIEKADNNLIRGYTGFLWEKIDV